jgi:hypothetical protein
MVDGKLSDFSWLKTGLFFVFSFLGALFYNLVWTTGGLWSSLVGALEVGVVVVLGLVLVIGLGNLRGLRFLDKFPFFVAGLLFFSGLLTFFYGWFTSMAGFGLLLYFVFVQLILTIVSLVLVWCVVKMRR